MPRKNMNTALKKRIMSFGEELENGKTFKKVRTSELLDKKFLFIFGDDGGDTYFFTVDTEKEFNEKIKSWLLSDRNCDFNTSVYLIVKNGEEYTPNIS